MYDLDSLSLESVIVKRESDDEFSRFVPYLAPNFKELVKNCLLFFSFSKYLEEMSI